MSWNKLLKELTIFPRKTNTMVALSSLWNVSHDPHFSELASDSQNDVQNADTRTNAEGSQFIV